MKGILSLLLIASTLMIPALARADNNQYNDPAMSFTAPPDFQQTPVPSHDPASFDDPTVVAAFMKNPGQRNAMQIVVRMQNFSGDASAFELNVENDLRNSTNDFFIKKTETKLPNGMPAYWQEITVGSGFDTMKVFEYVWVDGLRGVQLSISSRGGSLDEPTAKRALANVSAVAYPRNRY